MPGQEPERERRGQVGRDEPEAEVGHGRHERPGANSRGPGMTSGRPDRRPGRWPHREPDQDDDRQPGSPAGRAPFGAQDRGDRGGRERRRHRAGIPIEMSSSWPQRRRLDLEGPGRRVSVGSVRVHDPGPAQDLRAVLATSHAAQGRDRLVGARLDDLGLGGHGVTDVDRRRIVPFLVQEHAARPGQDLGDQRVEQPRRQPAVDDQRARSVRRREVGDRSAAGCGRRSGRRTSRRRRP